MAEIRKAEFWWASVHGADPEPVEKTEHEGRPCVYTMGCEDPFYLDTEPCVVVFVPASNNGDAASPLHRPLHPDVAETRRQEAQANADAESAAYRKGSKTYVRVDGTRAPAAHHGWRGPR